MHSHSLFLKIRFFLLIRRRELSNSISLQKCFHQIKIPFRLNDKAHMTARNCADLRIQFPEQICEPFLIFLLKCHFPGGGSVSSPADIQNHLLGKAGNPSAYIHTGSYGCTFCKKHRQFSNRCQPARCAECFFSYTAAAMHQQIKRFVSSFFIFFASCASILWFSCKNRSGHFRALASCFSPRSASDAARYS